MHMNTDTLVISSSDLNLILNGLQRAEGYAKFGSEAGACEAAGILRADRQMLATYARPVCRTRDCMEPVASRRDGTLDPSGWCASCGMVPEPTCSSCGVDIAGDTDMCGDCEASERRLIDADLRNAQGAM